MKKNLLILIVALLIAGSLIILLTVRTDLIPFDSQSEKIYQIELGENGFSPSEIKINAGDSVKFTTTLGEPFWPASDLHPTHGIYPEFDPQEPIEPNTSWKFTFNKKGSWRYHDHLSPYFRGTIVVE